jgi:hypothetical protein
VTASVRLLSLSPMSLPCALLDTSMDALAWLDARSNSAGVKNGSSSHSNGHFNNSKGSGNTFNDGMRFDNSTKTFQLLGAIEFQAAKSIRTSTIILAAFNVVAAFGTAAAILYDCYASTRRSNPKYSIKRSGLQFVNNAEVYPLVLSLGIVIQGIVFAAAQSTGLDNLLTKGCTAIAEYLLPGESLPIDPG